MSLKSMISCHVRDLQGASFPSSNVMHYHAVPYHLPKLDMSGWLRLSRQSLLWPRSFLTALSDEVNG